MRKPRNLRRAVRRHVAVESKALTPEVMMALYDGYKSGRGGTIRAKQNPEWGEWRVTNHTTFDGNEWWDIDKLDGRGGTTLGAGEFRFWEVVELPRGAPEKFGMARRRRSAATRRRTVASRRHTAQLKWDDLELSGWWDSESADFQTFVLRLLASIPGGDDFEDMGFEPLTNLGWKEVELITELLDKIQSTRDVESLYQGLIGRELEEDEEY